MVYVCFSCYTEWISMRYVTNSIFFLNIYWRTKNLITLFQMYVIIKYGKKRPLGRQVTFSLRYFYRCLKEVADLNMFDITFSFVCYTYIIFKYMKIFIHLRKKNILTYIVSVMCFFYILHNRGKVTLILVTYFSKRFFFYFSLSYIGGYEV